MQTLQNWQNIVAGTAVTENSSLVAADRQQDDLDEIEIWRFFLALLGILVLAESLLGNRYLNIKTGSF